MQIAKIAFQKGRADTDLGSFQILVAETEAVVEGVDALLPTAGQAAAVPIEWLGQVRISD
jgi:hypothetical protein